MQIAYVKLNLIWGCLSLETFLLGPVKTTLDSLQTSVIKCGLRRKEKGGESSEESCDPQIEWRSLLESCITGLLVVGSGNLDLLFSITPRLLKLPAF